MLYHVVSYFKLRLFDLTDSQFEIAKKCDIRLQRI